MRYYVYIYKDPNDGEIFYVGKGTGQRAFSHLKKREKKIPLHNSDLTFEIDKILENKQKPIIEIIQYFDEEITALEKENELIKEIGIENLTNKIDSLWPPIMPPDVIAKRSNTCKNNPKWRATMASKDYSEKLSRAVKQGIQEKGGRKPLSLKHRESLSKKLKGKQIGLNNPMSKNTPEQIFSYLVAVMNGEHWKEAAKKIGISNAWNVVQRKSWKSVDPPPGYEPPQKRRKLTDEIKKEIIYLHELGKSRKEISKIVMFSTTTINNIIKNQNNL
jgi:hypothetical protein